MTLNMDYTSFNALSSEQRSLIDFTQYLGSVNYSADMNEGSTRQEAELLMSLLDSKEGNDGYYNHISSSESESSYLSDSSRRDHFVFTCPSLALEEGKASHVKGSESKYLNNHASEPNNDTHTIKTITQEPAKLLGRPLKIDNRDALRLSSDAMGRNLQHSLQKAIEWRIQTWMDALTEDIVEMEQEAEAEGLSEDEIKDITKTPQALLYLALRQLSQDIKVTGAITGFQILQEEPKPSLTEPETKRRRIQKVLDADDSAEFKSSEDQALVLNCIFNLDTPAGYSEISLRVPGKIHGSFAFSGMEAYPEDITNVSIELDTEMIAAMLEESSRKIVKACTENFFESVEINSEAPVETAVAGEGTVHSPKPSEAAPSEEPEASVQLPMVSPPATTHSPSSSVNTKLFSPPPIPDDFDPRRISPQTTGHSPPSVNFAPRTPMRTFSGAPSLVSPPINTSHEYHEVGATSPSFPILVEAACRAETKAEN